MFALDSLVYATMSGHEVFDMLSDEEVQNRYANGQFPPDVMPLGCGELIVTCWDPVFAINF